MKVIKVPGTFYAFGNLALLWGNIGKACNNVIYIDIDIYDMGKFAISGKNLDGLKRWNLFVI